MQTGDLPKISPLPEDEKLQDRLGITPSGPTSRPSGAGLIEWRFREPTERFTDQRGYWNFLILVALTVFFRDGFDFRIEPERTLSL